MLRAYFVPKHLVQILDSQRPLRRNGVERSLYSRAVGYSFNSEKICNKDGEVTRVPIVEHVPPDVTAQIFWLKNRKPTEWRDVQQMEHVLGKYIISDKPMTEEEWISAVSARASERCHGRLPLIEGRRLWKFELRNDRSPLHQ